MAGSFYPQDGCEPAGGSSPVEDGRDSERFVLGMTLGNHSSTTSALIHNVLTEYGPIGTHATNGSTGEYPPRAYPTCVHIF